MADIASRRLSWDRRQSARTLWRHINRNDDVEARAKAAPSTIQNWFYEMRPAPLKMDTDLQGFLVMRLRAQIRIDLEAASFAEAAAHQERVEAAFAEVQRRFENAVLEFKQRRERIRAGESRQNHAPTHYTGRMRAYE